MERKKLEGLPKQTGVYLMKDARGKVLYVGKAVDLRSRVRSYFRPTGVQRPALRLLVPRIADIDYIVTDTEKEALLLEHNLIKENSPPYNVVFRDDKTYVHLRLSVRDEFPRITIVRRPKRDGALYFGPYSSAQAVRETLRFLQRHFRLRACSDAEFRKGRPCTRYQIGLCSAPCAGLISRKAHDAVARRVTLFLRGKGEELLEELEEKMEEESGALRFEEAGKTLRTIRAIRKTGERQKISSVEGVERDAVGYARTGDRAKIVVLLIRGGALVGKTSHSSGRAKAPQAEALASFLRGYYLGVRLVPAEILLPAEIEGREALEELLSEARGKSARILVPKRGKKRELVAMAVKNAELLLKSEAESRETLRRSLADLQGRCGLSRLPQTIECFDISNIGGRRAVGSCVSFCEGLSNKDGYRRYKIRRGESPDDYAMMWEMLERRLTRGKEEERLPDLLMVDGGKGQLSVAVRVAGSLGLGRMDFLALAKGRGEEDKVYLPGRKNPVRLPKSSAAYLLLQQIRDEAHRFAVSYHRKLRRKSLKRSPLDDVPGIGPKRKARLLRAFGSLKRIRAASPKELVEKGRIPKPLAEEIHKALRPISD